jgi:hypothetical protein
MPNIPQDDAVALKSNITAPHYGALLDVGLGCLRKESPCRIERSLPLPPRAYFASRAFPPRLWHIEEDIARAVFALALIMAASTVVVPIAAAYIAERMCALA